MQANLARRALVNEYTRAFFRERGFLEVETPIRVPTLAPEEHIVPFESEGWFLSTSPELHMKRLLAAGYEKLFQMRSCFRKGESGRHHNPEFAMIEWYRAGAGYLDMMKDTQELVSGLALKLKGSLKLTYHGNVIDLSMPWPAATVAEAFTAAAGWDPVVTSDPARFDLDLMTKVIPYFGNERPIIVTDYPASMSSLSRMKPGDPAVAERAEVFIAGLELANAFSELTSATEQARRFSEEIQRIERRSGKRMEMPASFI